MIRVIFIFLTVSVLSACSPGKKDTTYAFYYWQQANSFSDSTSHWIERLNISKFYVHIMDVVWSSEKQQPAPTAITALSASNPITGKSLVPVIFINNEVIDKADTTQLQELTINLLSAARGFMDKMGSPLAELQIDCDWTAKTRDKYFLLLQQLKQLSPGTTYAATIRLYPYKYDRQMGVPPVDYGALMFYNLTSIKNPEEENSIFTYKAASQYRRSNPYPIPLKAILPVFGWYAWFRNNDYKGILYESPDLTGQSFCTRISKTKFRVLKDTVVNGLYLRNGDILRNEFPDTKDLSAFNKNLDNLLPGSNEVIFYHWNERFLQHYDTAIKEITGH